MEIISFDNNIYDIIRRNIKKYRIERQMTAAILAELIDISDDFLRQIESEKVARHPSFRTLYKLSVALGVSLDDLIRE